MKFLILQRLPSILLIALWVASSGCQSTVNHVNERFGMDPRDRFVESLDRAHQSLLGVHQSFADASNGLENFDGHTESTLRDRYERLSEQYVASEVALAGAEVEMGDLENAARSFFLSWENDLFKYSDPVVRDASRLQLSQARQEYEGVIAQVKKTQDRAAQELTAFQDYLYFLRQNLNSQAYSALQEPGVDLRLRIEELLEELVNAMDTVQELRGSLQVD